MAKRLREIFQARLIIIIVIFLAASLFPGAAYAQAGGAGWNLVFSDEFNDNAPNTSVWATAPPAPFHRYNDDSIEYFSDDDVTESGGQLHLKAEERTVTENGVTRYYTAGVISGHKSVALTYGYWEMRFKSPSGNGYWPAFWTLPTSGGSGPPEIDFVELLMKTPTIAYMTLHASSGDVSSSYNGPDYSKNFHVFAADWEPGSLTWYIDGVARYTATGSKVPSVPMYPIGNLAVGGGWAGPPDDTTPFPSTMDIDYVRIYQKVSSGACYSSIPKPADPIPIKDCSGTDTTPPTLSSIASSGITTTGATITWITNEASDTQIDYGTSTSYGNSTTLNTSMVTSHSQALSGLTAGTTYHFRVKSKDAAGNLATSGDYTFTTTASSPPAAEILLEDFATPIRQTSEGDLFKTYNGEDPGQTYSFAGNMMQVNGAPGNCGGSDCGIYWQFLPYPYVAPLGFASGRIKSGTWDPDVNHLRFSFRCTKAVAKTSSGYGNIQIGTYVKSKSDTDVSNQGAHFYHHLDPNVYPNRWVYVDINRHPQHQVGTDSNTNWPNDPIASTVHYFDGLTRFYFDTQTTSSGGNWNGQTCYFRDIRFTKVSGEPDYEVSSITATYSGTAYEVAWAGLKTSNINYDVYYSASSMKPGGVATGTFGSTVSSTGNAYTDILWTSTPMAERADGLYVAIKPQGYSTFTEIYIPGPGGTPPDTTPPEISSVASSSVTANNATITWITNETSDTQVEYGTTISYGSSTVLNSTMTASHSQRLSGLMSGTVYHYRARSRDLSGNLATSGDYTFTTAGAGDTTPPSVSITSPAAGATVSGTVTITANASDNVGVAGVQFRVDGNNIGSEDTVSPYSISWDSKSVANGTHTITAVARDAAGNSATSVGISISVANTYSAGGLTLALSLDEGSGTIASDSSGSGNTATLNGATWTTGKFGSGLSFDGANDYAGPAANKPFSNDINSMSVSVWFKTNASGVIISDNNCPAGSGGSSCGSWDPLIYVQTDGKLRAGGYAGGYPNLISQNAVNDNTWHHAALTINKSGTTAQSLYLDGALVNKVTGTMDGVSGQNYWYMGTGYTNQWPLANSGWFYFSGAIDNVRIYNRTLTVAEIQQDMNTPVGGTAGYNKADSNRNSCIEMSELNDFINRWKVSIADVGIREIIEAIGLWKKGC